MHDPTETLRKRIENDREATVIEVRAADSGPVVVLRYPRVKPVVLPIADAREVTDEPDALEADTVLIELEKHDTRHAAPAVYERAGVRYINGVDPDREESGDYVHVSENFNNDTRHPHRHLVSDPGYDRQIDRKFYLFE